VQGSRQTWFYAAMAFWAGALIVVWAHVTPTGAPHGVAEAALPAATAGLCLVQRRRIRAKTGQDARQWTYLAAFSIAVAVFSLIGAVPGLA
jgi:hypothetical protein